MTNSKILVLGGTGFAGICLLRELVHRKKPTIVYARNPSKIPTDLVSSPLIEVISGEISDLSQHDNVIPKFSAVISLLGPHINDYKLDRTLFADQYKLFVFPFMRQRGVRRIIAICTLSVSRQEDHWTSFAVMVQIFMRVLARNTYIAMHNIADTFSSKAQDLDWILIRLARIPGESDEESWRKDRRDGTVFVGWVGENGWTSSVKRGALAKWLVDAVEGSADEWIGRMPAVSRLAGN